MGELGIYGEHATADYINCRIPMIVRWPGNTDEGRVDNGLHYNLDLAPTLAEMFDKKPSSQWDGKSFASSIVSNNETGHDYLVISQCAHVCQRGVRFGDWMYIRTYHDGYHLFPKEMLFNIKEDFHEQNNLAEERKDICKEAVYLLNEWHDEMMNTMEHDTDPLWTVMKEGGPFHANEKDKRLEEYCEFLKQTDRSWAIPELKRKHPEGFKKNGVV
jgi:arylsulfatase A-like enzyme